MTNPLTFDEVITVAKDIETIAADLNPANYGHPLTTMIDVLDAVIDALTLVDDIQEAWSVCSTAWSALTDAMDVLDQFGDVIPGVDIVIEVVDGIDSAFEVVDDALNTAFDTADEAIDTIEPILRDISVGLKEIRSLIQQIESDLPAMVNLLEIFKALSEIVVAIAPVFEGTEVGARLQKLETEYDTLRGDVQKVATPLHAALSDLSTPISDVKDAVDAIDGVVGSKFKTIETDFSWVASEVGKVENDVVSIANHLGPLRWVLGKAKSIEEKILKPITHEILKVTHLNELEKSVVGKIKSRLGFDALQAFNNQGDHRSTIKGHHGKTGSKNAGALKDMFKDFAGALAAYKKGDKKTAFEDAVEGLLDALTGGTIDLSKMPPEIPQPKPVLNIPSTDPANVVVPQRARTMARACVHPSGPAPQLGFGAAQEIVGFGAQLPAGNPADTSAQVALQNAAKGAIAALAASAAPYQNGVVNLQNVLAHSRGPTNSNVEIGALAVIAKAIADTVARAVQLWSSAQPPHPKKTDTTEKAVAAMEPYIKALQDLALQLETVAGKEQTFAAATTGLTEQVGTALKQIGGVAHLTVSANTFAGISASGATIVQFLAQLDQLNASLGHTYDTQVTHVHSIFQNAAQAEAEQITGVGKMAQTVTSALSGVVNASAPMATAYADLDAWGVPIATKWIPQLLIAEKYAKAIDGILDPLSYLIKLMDSYSPSNTAMVGQDESKIGAMILSVVHTLYEFVLEAISEVLAVMPKTLETLTVDALDLPRITKILDTAIANVPPQIAVLHRNAAAVATTGDAIKTASVPPKTYQWTNPKTGKTVTFSNAFITEAEAKQITVLILRMMKDANARGIAMPDIPPMIAPPRAAVAALAE